MLIEERNSAFIVILSKSIKAITKLRIQASDLAEGVVYQKGTISDSYSLPLSIVELMRRFVVLFLGIERSIVFVDARFKGWKFEARQEPVMSFRNAVNTLQKLEFDVHVSLSEARKELCVMVRSRADDNDFLLKLSLGPECILAWLMRRFIVKPVDHGVGASELYREYISALVSVVRVVNPSKRT
jgi:hypothetical protein